MYLIFILDDVYGAYALLKCIQFYTRWCVRGVCSSRMYQFFILDDVHGAYALLVYIQFLSWMMYMGLMLFSYVSNFYTG